MHSHLLRALLEQHDKHHRAVANLRVCLIHIDYLNTQVLVATLAAVIMSNAPRMFQSAPIRTFSAGLRQQSVLAGRRQAFQSLRQPLQRRTAATTTVPPVQGAPGEAQSGFAKLWNSPVGPKTVHFWAPVMKVRMHPPPTLSDAFFDAASRNTCRRLPSTVTTSIVDNKFTFANIYNNSGVSSWPVSPTLRAPLSSSL